MPSTLSNPWIGYSSRDYDTIKSAYISGLSVPSNGLTEITDYSDSNPLIKEINIISGLAEMLGYWIDNEARESFLISVRIIDNAIKIARSFDYKVKGKIGSYGVLTFTLDASVGSDTTIPAGTVCKNEQGDVFVETISEAVIDAGETEVNVDARQWTSSALTNVGSTDGSINQIINVGKDVSEGSLIVRVGPSVFYTEVETFSESGSTDTHFLTRMNKDKEIEVVFGDGVNGIIPTAALNIWIQKSTTLGSNGNFGKNFITAIDSVITVPEGETINVSNIAEFSGGSDEETVSIIKRNIPKRLRTLERAVIEQDYVDIAELTSGVGKAGVVFNNGKKVKIYIVPTGGGTASGALLTAVSNYMDDKRMITTTIEPLAAGTVNLAMRMNIIVRSGYSKVSVTNSILAALTDLFATENQTIGGRIYLGDVYEVIEAVEGVDSSEITFIGAKPSAKIIKSTPASKELSWTRTPQNGITNSVWRFLFVSSSSFQILKDSVYLGTYSINITYTLENLTFKVLANSYVNGDKYEFITYGINTNIQLQEPSLFAVDSGDIQISTQGGF